MRATVRNPRPMNAPARGPDRSSGRRVGRRVLAAAGASAGRGLGSGTAGLHHGEEHRPARRQRNPAGDRLRRRQLLGRRIARIAGCSERCTAAARYPLRVVADVRRRLAVWIGPSKIAAGRRRRRRRSAGVAAAAWHGAGIGGDGAPERAVPQRSAGEAASSAGGGAGEPASASEWRGGCVAVGWRRGCRRGLRLAAGRRAS